MGVGTTEAIGPQTPAAKECRPLTAARAKGVETEW